MESWFCIWDDLENPKTRLNLVPTNRSATPTVGKPSLLPHDVLPTVAFDAFRKGVKNSVRNDDKAERSLSDSFDRQKTERKKTKNMIKKVIILIQLIVTTLIFGQNKNNYSEIKKTKKTFEINLNQNKIIVAEITGFEDNTIVKLFDQDLQELIDSTIVLNNKFILKNNIKNIIPRNLNLVLIPNKIPISIILFIANENIKISGDKSDFPYDLKISGSKNQDLQKIINQKVKVIEKERNEIVKFWRTEEKDTNEVYKAKLKLSYNRANEIDKSNDSIRKVFIDKNPNSYVSLNQLRYLKYKYSKSELKKIYKSLENKYKSSEDGKSLLTYIEIGDKIKDGDLFFDFEAKDKNGIKHKLSDYKGKIILLDFTKEFCAPCEASIKELKNILFEYKEKLKIVSFTVEKSENFWKKGLIRNNIEWLSLWDGQGNSSKVIMKYGVQGFPHFFFINTDGKTVKNIIGYSEGILKTEVEKMIKK